MVALKEFADFIVLNMANLSETYARLLAESRAGYETFSVASRKTSARKLLNAVAQACREENAEPLSRMFAGSITSQASLGDAPPSPRWPEDVVPPRPLVELECLGQTLTPVVTNLEAGKFLWHILAQMRAALLPAAGVPAPLPAKPRPPAPAESGPPPSPPSVDEASLRPILDAVLDAVIVIDDRGVIAEWNSRAEAMFGRPRAEAIGRQLAEIIIPQEHREAYHRGMSHFLATGEGAILNKRVEMNVLHRDGHEFPVELTIVPLVAGNTYRFSAFVRDISERKQAEAALHESEEKYRLVVENAGEAIVVAQEGMVKFFNQKLLDFARGYTPDELLSRPFIEFIHPDDRQMVLERHQKRLAGQDVPPVYAFRIVDKQGQITWVEINVITITWEEKPATLFFMNDITRRREAEDTMRQANWVIENSPAVLFRWQAAEGWPVVFVSKNVAQFGYTPEELLSGETPYNSIVHPDDLERVGREVQEYSAAGVEHFRQEYRIVTKDGRVRWTDDRTVIERDAEGRITHYQGIVLDITERKQAEEELREYRQRLEEMVEARTAELARERSLLRTLIDNLPDYIYVKDVKSRFVLLNQAAMRSFDNVSMEDVIGKTDFDIHPPELAQKYYTDEQTLFQSGQERITVEEPVFEAGVEKWFLTTKILLRDSQGEVTGLVGIGRDITDRKRAEVERERLLADIQQSQELLRTVIDATPDWIFVKDRQHRYRLVNQGYAGSLHLQPDDLIGKNDLEVGFPEDIVKGNPGKGIRGFWPDDTEVMDSGQTKIIEVEPAVIDGRPVFLSTIKVPLRDASGEVWGVLGYARDITERERLLAESERQARREQTIREITEKMRAAASLDQLVRVAAEELGRRFSADYALVDFGLEPNGHTSTQTTRSKE